MTRLASLLARRAPRSAYVPMLVVAMLLTACVRWEAVSPADAPPRLPRLVRVTSRDSTHRMLEDAAFRSDTLVGRASDQPDSPDVRIPLADIAHLEARVPSVSGSLGVAVAVLAALASFVYFVGHAVN